jgi:hypothetical protein
MKKVFAAFIFIFFYSGFCVAADSGDAEVIAYYFHGDFRCSNCHRIEQYSKEAVDKYFAKELASGKLGYKVINIDRKANTHFAEDYKLYTKSLVISKIKDGKEIGYKNLEKVWNYLIDREAFHDYVKKEISEYLTENK